MYPIQSSTYYSIVFTVIAKYLFPTTVSVTPTIIMRFSGPTTSQAAQTLYGISLEFEFYKSTQYNVIIVWKINKTCSKFHFFEKIAIKKTQLAFVFYCLFASRAISKPFY